MTEWLVIYEHAEDGSWGAYSPDIPGVVAVGTSREEVETRMREAIPAHLKYLREFGMELPKPHNHAARIAA